MKKTTRTLLAFDERQLEAISKLRIAFAGDDKQDISNKDLLLIALGIGFNAKNKLSDFKRSNTGVRMEYFKAEDNAIFAGLQVYETNKAESLLEIEALYNLAEQYAAGGIALLTEALERERDFHEWFHGYVYGCLEDLREPVGA